MKTQKEELIDFLYWTQNNPLEILKYSYEELVDRYIKSINSDGPREPEADGCNKQTQEVCACCGLPLDKGYVHSKCTYETFNNKS